MRQQREYMFVSYVALGIQVTRPNGESEIVKKGLTRGLTSYCQVLNDLGADGWEAVLSQHHTVDGILLKRIKE